MPRTMRAIPQLPTEPVEAQTAMPISVRAARLEQRPRRVADNVLQDQLLRQECHGQFINKLYPLGDDASTILRYTEELHCGEMYLNIIDQYSSKSIALNAKKAYDLYKALGELIGGINVKG